MLRRVGFGCLGSFVFYFVGALGGGFLISALSSNTHDKSMEAAMTGAFVTGPIGALLGGILGAVLPRNAKRPPESIEKKESLAKPHPNRQ